MPNSAPDFKPIYPAGWEWAAASPGARKLIDRVAVNTPQRIFPEIPGRDPIMSNDAKQLNYTRKLADELSSALPVDIDEGTGLAGPSGITSDFYSLRTVSGALMNPMTVPLVDNAILADELDLATGFISTRHQRIWEELFDFMFRTVVPASMSIRKQATAGLAHPTANVAIKKDIFARTARHCPSIAAAIERNQVRELFNKTGFVNATVTGVRGQSDTVIKLPDGTFTSKPRKVNDLDFAISGGKHGVRSDASKSVDFGSGIIDGHFAMRRRTVYAAPGWINYFITALLAPFREHYLTQGEFTWKHRTAQHIKEKLQRFAFFVGVDVSQFDQAVLKWVLDWMLDRWSLVYTDDAVTMMRSVLYAPIAQPDPAVYGRAKGVIPKPVFIGDPMDTTTWTNCVGLPSGVAMNPDIGKFVNTATMLCLLDDYSGDILEVGVSKFLRGEHPNFGLLNMGDDGILMFNDAAFRAWFDTNVKKKSYVRIGPEDGVSFLGNIPLFDTSGELQVSPDMVTFVRNWLVPERGLPRPDENSTGRTGRAFAAALGWFARIAHYQTAVSFSEVWHIWERAHHDAFDETLESRMVYWKQHMKLPPLDSLSDADRMYLIDPTKIYYRFQESDITPWILDLDRASMTFDEYFPLIERYIK